MAAPPLSPDPAQAAVLSHRDGALLVVGGPGTGKTAVLLERFARLLEEGAEPDRTVLVTGSRRARDAARAFMLERVAVSSSGPQIVTGHGLAHRILKEREGEAPEVLGAAEQFAKVQELLAAQDPDEWPAYGRLLGLRGFADQVRQLLARMQESLWTPDRIDEAADRGGLHGWHELARFAREYQDALDMVNQVDYAGLLQRVAASEGPALFDHVLVDDYQDTTFAFEAVLRGLGAGDVVVAADPDAHVFSFQGATDEPAARFTSEAFPGATTVELTVPHRAPEPIEVRAWVTPHTSEEHAAVARELRRRHVDDGVAWRDMAVIVRRQGTHLGTLLRAIDDALIPRAVPERGLSLVAEAATYPYVLALRWLVADPPRREELIEPLLTSDVVGLSPAAARGLIRLAKTTGERRAAEAIERTDGLSPDEAVAVTSAREVLDRASLFAGMSVQDSFRVLWEGLACSRRIVAAGGQGLDTVVTFADVVAAASEGVETGVEAFLESLDAGRQGPGWAAREAGGADAVQVLTAHGAAGREFDTVVVAGAIEGNFPSLQRPEPMFDLAALEGAITRSAHVRERLADERRLFRMVLARARRRAVLVASDAHPDELSMRSRFVDELDEVAWEPAPAADDDHPVSVREAVARWRRQLADPSAAAWRRLAALDGLHAIGADPGTWWFQRDWTETGRPLREELRLSYSRLSTLDNCELQHVLGDELGLGRAAGFNAWVGKLVHGLIEDLEQHRIGNTKDEILAELDRRWRDQEFPSKAVAAAYRRLIEDRMLPNWWHNYGVGESLANELFFEFPFEGATIVGVIDRIGSLEGEGTRITDFKTGKADNAPKAAESLQLGIYYLAVQHSEDLAPYRPVRVVELAYIQGGWRAPHEMPGNAWRIADDTAEPYQEAVEAELSRLIAEKRRLLELEVFRPNPFANCRWCDFQTLCPLYPQGQEVFPIEAVTS